VSGCECRDGVALKDGPGAAKSADRKEKLDKLSRFVQDASKRRFHGKVIVTYRDGTPQHVEVTETHKL